ncbi:hypothetical protein WA026_001671 [Henosepilachna vigintioctopunctata]|uniref:Cathepsin L n=1 Tax=Henosepilachna vigintioctopunctata TaxID=420089 RepID=A0AAW1UIX8_9CUCU
MKDIILLSILVIAVESVSDEKLKKAWANFKDQFGREYASAGESDNRKVIFEENLRIIENHNALYAEGKETYQMGITPFTDWTTEEFTGYINKFKLKGEQHGKTRVYNKSHSVPESMDWRLKRVVTEVKTQGHCGSCWTFSATGALESHAALHLGKRVSLSEQNLLDCADKSYGNLGCDGGDMNMAFLYVKDKGIEKELDYPYVAHQGTCKQEGAELYVAEYMNIKPTEDALKEAVANIGPISVAIEASSQLQNYVSGVFLDRTCTADLNHAVLAVGYGVENGNDYWLLKNSWGFEWGEQGYLKLARNKYNNCGVGLRASYPVVSNDKI